MLEENGERGGKTDTDKQRGKYISSLAAKKFLNAFQTLIIFHFVSAITWKRQIKMGTIQRSHYLFGLGGLKLCLAMSLSLQNHYCVFE